MPRRTFTLAEKITIAQGWVIARASGETQEAYAASCGVSPRRVREFVQEYAPSTQDASRAARRIVAEAIERLRLVLAQLDADASQPPAEATPARPAADIPRHEETHPKDTLAKGAPPGSSAPVGAPQARKLFNWDLD